MTTGPAPSLSKRGEAELAARKEREAAALRANLRRRKAQQAADGQSGKAKPTEPSDRR